MRKFKIGDRVIISIKQFKGKETILYEKGEVFGRAPGDSSYWITRDGEFGKYKNRFPIGCLKMDVQYYREKRLNKLLG